MLATATVIAQEYHGEMERLYPDKTKTTKKTTKKNTTTEKKTDTDEKKPVSKAASEPTTTLLTHRAQPLKQHKHSLSYRKVH